MYNAKLKDSHFYISLYMYLEQRSALESVIYNFDISCGYNTENTFCLISLHKNLSK